MPDKDAFGDLRRAKEEEYFRRKEKELLEKLRSRALMESERRQMGEAIGVSDQDILQTLHDLGYTRDNVTLLHLVPLLQVAWADGTVTKREAERILEVAAIRGIKAGTPAYLLLENWLAQRPSEEFFEKTLRVIGALLRALPAEKRNASSRDLVSYCTSVAAASGGILGLGDKISNTEEKLLEKIASELEHAHDAAAKKVMKDA